MVLEVTNLSVVRTKVVSPLTDAMCLVNDNAGQLLGLVQSLKRIDHSDILGQHLGGDVQQLYDLLRLWSVESSEEELLLLR